MARRTPTKKEYQSPTPASMRGVERVRELRIRPAKDVSLTGTIDQMLEEMHKAQKAFGGVAGAFNAVVPAELARRTVIEGLSRGVLMVRVPDASTRFALDRFLRSGGERALIGACKVAVRSVRVMAGSIVQ